MPLAVLVLVGTAAAIYWLLMRRDDAGAELAPADNAPAGGGIDWATQYPDMGQSAEEFTAAAPAAPQLFATYRAPAAAAPYLDTINAASAAQNLPDGLLARVLDQESAYRADVISGKTKSAAGAVGIAQMMPTTAKDLGVNPLDPAEAIPGAARYLRQLFDKLGSWPAALAGYNWGAGNVERKGMTAAPAETKNYVASIVRDLPHIS